MEKKIDIGQNARVWIDWHVKPIDHSPEGERGIAALFAKKYGIPINNITVTASLDTKNANGVDEGLNATDAKSIQDPKFQAELIKQYIKECGLEDNCNIDEILKIDSQVNSLIDYSLYEKSKRYQIKWVRWDNFLSYGPDNYFDFTKLKGLVLLNGEPANESGKSTFAYDLLHFLLFGKTNQDKAKTNEQLFNNYRKNVNEVLVEGCICIDNEDYVIRRVLSRKGKTKITVSQKVSYYHVLSNGSEEELVDTENGSAENTAKTNKVIKEALGNEKDFDLIISANSKDLDELISMGDTDRGKLLSRWIGLSPLEDKEIKAKSIRKTQLSAGRYCDLYNKVTLQSEIEELTKSIGDTEEAIKAEQKRHDDATVEHNRLTGEKETLLTSKIAIDASLSQYDLTTEQNGLNVIVEEGKKNKAKLDAIEKELSDMPVVEFDNADYDNKVSKKEVLIEEIATIKSKISLLKETNTILTNQEYCPTCGKKLDNVNNQEKIAKNKQEIETLIASGVTKNDEKKQLETEIIGMDTARKQALERSKIELKKMAVNTDIIEGRQRYKDKKSIIDKLIANEEAIKTNNEIDTKINLLKTNISTQLGVIQATDTNMAAYRKSIENMNSGILDRNSKISAINKELEDEKNWNVYLKAIGKDGICKMVLKHALPIINTELRNLLHDCADFDVEVTLNEANAVEFWLIRDNVKTRLSAASGLERTEASLALRVVLGKMSRLSCPPFILLDEVLGTVAAENYDKMKKLYDKITTMYDFVLHITHLNAITDWHDMTITVVKKDNISSVKPLIKK